MKRLVILAASLPLLFLANANVSAQVRIAVTGGVNLTSSKERLPNLAFGTEAVPRSSRIGLSAIVPLPWMFALELGGAYSERGRELVYGWCGYPPRERALVSMEYLEFRAAGRVNLPLAGNRVLAFATAGPTLAWELSCHSSPTTPTDPLYGSGSRSCGGIAELDLDKLDFGLAGGVGLEVGMTGRLGLTVSTVYNRGMRDLIPGEDYSVKLRTVTIRGGLVYRID